MTAQDVVIPKPVQGGYVPMDAMMKFAISGNAMMLIASILIVVLVLNI